jgi:hypothetical protein
MAVAWVGIGTADGVADTDDVSLSPSIPSGSNGDLLVCVVTHLEASRYPSASGWTDLIGDNFSLLYRIADGSEGANLSVTMALTYNRAQAVILRFSGATTTGIDKGTQYQETAWTNTGTLPTITALAGGACIYVGGGMQYDNRASACSRTGATERYDAVAGAGRVLWVFTEENTSAGTISSATITYADYANGIYLQSFVIPAAAGGGGSFSPYLHQPQAWQFVGRK